MKTIIVTLSILLNVGLASVFIWILSHPPQAEPTAALEPALPPAPSSPSAPLPHVVVKTVTTNFHWSQIESTDYLDYIHNLRAIGCPEETIRDIIVADVNKLFAPRYAALTGTAPELAWWGRYDKRKPLRAELAAQLRALHEEKKALLARLLGPGVEVARALVEESVAVVRENNTYAFLPESKQTAVRNLMSRYEALREWNEPQWRSLSGEERAARERELQAARDGELAALLTPEELHEFELRHSQTADTLREQYGQADLTEAEFRQMFDLQRQFEREHPQVTMEDSKQLEADYTASLGADRYADLKRQNDATWQALQTLAAENAFAPEALNQAYALKQEYTGRLVEAFGPFLSDPANDPAPLRTIAAEMDDRLASILGSESVKQLDRLGALPRLVVEDDGLSRRYRLAR